MKTNNFKILLYIAAISFILTQMCYAVPNISETADKPAASKNNASDIKSPSAILIDAGRNQVLYSKESDTRQHVSTASKLMTTLVVLDKKKDDLNANVTISKDSVDAEGSALSLEVGEKYTVEDLLYGIMLTSANDAAKALAEYVGGDISAFVKLMNDKSLELNMKDTHFSNPTGLYEDGQYTTAGDLAKLISHALGDSAAFNRIFSTQIKPWYTHDGKTVLLQSQNKLFWKYDGVVGGKTGYNFKDQITGITTAIRNDRRLICIVLNSPEDIMYDDTTKLLDYGFNNFRSTILIKKGDPQKSINAGNTEVNLVCNSDIYYTHPIGESYIKSIQFNTPDTLTVPVYKDKLAGTVKYILNDDTVIEANLYPDSDVVPPDDFYTSLYKKFLENKDILLLIAILLVIEVFLILYNIAKLIQKLIRKMTGRKTNNLREH